MSALPLLLAIVGIIATIRYLLLNTTAGFCLRHGIDEENLFVEVSAHSLLDMSHDIYERRVRRREIYGSTRLTDFGIPLDIEEFRRVTAVSNKGYLLAVSDWFKNTREFRKDDRWTHEPMFEVRALTKTEQQTQWPKLLKETMRCERQISESRKPVTA
jgi:hypothetical protein